MRIISERRIREFGVQHPASRSLLHAWIHVIRRARFECFADIKRTYNRTDQVGTFVVFDVNSHRIVASVAYQLGCVYVKKIMTHSEYEAWSRVQR